jgi:hypothetical protein
MVIATRIPAGVIVSSEDSDRLSEHARFMHSVQQGLDDVAADIVVEDEDQDESLEKAFKRGAKK